MTKVRVLSGRHTGASIDWTLPLLKVGSSEEFDIYIGDWNAQAIELVRTPEGDCTAQWPVGEGDLPIDGAHGEGGTLSCELQPWVPVRFGTVILCVGPSDEDWPDDAQLLQRLFAPPPPPAVEAAPAVAKSRRYPLMLAATTAVVLVTSAVLVVASRGQSEAAVPLAVPTSAATVRNALADARWRDLDITDQGDGITVRGVLAERGDVTEAHQRLDAVKSTKPLTRHFIAAGEITDLVHESVPGAGLVVTRTGPRSFEVSGNAADVAHTKDAIKRLGVDLEGVGVQLVAAVTARETDAPQMSGTLIDSKGVSFARTRDGVKHIVMPNAPAASASVLAASAPAAQSIGPKTKE
jgi:type III secretion protein D